MYFNLNPQAWRRKVTEHPFEFEKQLILKIIGKSSFMDFYVGVKDEEIEIIIL